VSVERSTSEKKRERDKGVHFAVLEGVADLVEAVFERSKAQQEQEKERLAHVRTIGFTLACAQHTHTHTHHEKETRKR
jgi:hypothetical protein